jgi:dephospho-CoA kinase
MITLGLTGSIGMGKSTTGKLFEDEGAAVWDADAAVARLYGPGGAAVAALRDLRPDVIEGDGPDAHVDREALRAAVAEDADLIPELERIVHPLVGEDRETFLANARAEGREVAVCDVPLLYETGGERRYDAVVVVTAPADVQRERVLARPGMTEAVLDTILAKQTPDAEKRARADYVVDTSRGIEPARERVREILADAKGRF